MTKTIEAAAVASALYERDFYSRTQGQAALLRSGRLEALHVANILEEIETLGRSERASLKSAYRLICSHNPGPRPLRDEVFANAYALARGDAKRETGLPEATFPTMPPFSRDECEALGFLPQELRDQG